MVNESSVHHPLQASLAQAEEHLQFVLNNPSSGLVLERIQFALALIKFVRSKQDDDARQKARAARTNVTTSEASAAVPTGGGQAQERATD